MRRQDIVRKYLELAPQIGGHKAARALGSSKGTLWRWQKAFAAHGLDGLRPKFQNSGRRSAVAGVRLSARAIQYLERLIVTKGEQLAWQEFSQSPLCPAAVARLAYKSLPAPVERLVKLTPLQARCSAHVSADGRRVIIKVKFPRRTK